MWIRKMNLYGVQKVCFVDFIRESCVTIRTINGWQFLTRQTQHRCTRVENPGEGVRDVFAKISRRGQGFQEKLPGGVHLFCVLLHFY
jgi:hypothetical protein